MYQTDDYYYKLPKSLISQVPSDKRGNSRLLRLNRKTGSFSHHLFKDIEQFFRPSDILVINDTKVLPAKLLGKKKTGGKIEVIILDFVKYSKQIMESKQSKMFTCLIRSSRRSSPGTILLFKNKLEAIVLSFDDGIYSVMFNNMSLLQKVIYKFGELPLPPYIKRGTSSDKLYKTDMLRYQTVYASKEGAIAAPTAGLHITEEVIKKLKNIGVTLVAITLHIGYGTFVPVRVNDIREHKMHYEWFSITRNAANIINKGKDSGHRIVAVGTTSVRALEFSAHKGGILAGSRRKCNLFIYPGYKFKIVDAMITNFHLPRSTLLMLVSAFSSMDNVLNAYKAAVLEKYNFFSYGDAMMID